MPREAKTKPDDWVVFGVKIQRRDIELFKRLALENERNMGAQFRHMIKQERQRQQNAAQDGDKAE